MTRSRLPTVLRIGLILVALLTIAPWFGQERAVAGFGDRTLKLYHVHTGERAEFTFRKNGKYDPAVLKQMNWFLRDWRKKQPVDMDPRLFDLIWAVYQQTGSNGYVNVICGYRSPDTNAMLRSRTRGVAEHSQHTLGKAMDFYVPGVPLSKLRAIGLRMGVGGVGFYPTSGSPFVHMDVGHVRMWPRMPRQELMALFPAGDTLYIPADGKPLPGFKVALARYEKNENQQVAMLDSGSHKGGFLKRLFGGGRDEQEDADDDSAPVAAPRAAQPETLVASNDRQPAAPTPRLLKDRPTTLPVAQPATLQVASAEIADPAPLPHERIMPASMTVAMADSAPLPHDRPAAMLAAASEADRTALASVAGSAMPVDRPESAGSALAAANAFGQNGMTGATPLPTARPEQDIQLAYAEAESDGENPYDTAYGGRYADAASGKAAPAVTPAAHPAPAASAAPAAMAPRTGSLSRTALQRGNLAVRHAPVQLASALKGDRPTASGVSSAILRWNASLVHTAPDHRQLRQLMTAETADGAAMAGMTMPKLGGKNPLFTIASGKGVAFDRVNTPALPTDRFSRADEWTNAQADTGHLMRVAQR
ncbi:DUF882 domain-containing protein [Faunimonas pinastri]|nr:DUF882 domain-containing protein [Faunimonas pinastri]